MPNNVLRLDCTGGGCFVERNLGSDVPDVWVEFDVAFNAAFIAALLAASDPTDSPISGFAVHQFIGRHGAVLKWKCGAEAAFTPVSTIAALQFYHIKLRFQDGLPQTDMWVDGLLVGTDTSTTFTAQFLDLFSDFTVAAGYIYYDNFTAGIVEGGTSLGTDNFEGGSLAYWNGGTNDATIVADPGITPAIPSRGGAGSGRVLIAWDDGPLEPAPTWTVIDQATNGFPDQFVSGYDIRVGRQTLLSRTDTGTATVYVNDRDGLFDDRNVSSPYFGKLSGRQIMLQLYNPVSMVWEPQFRGLINDYSYTLDGSSVGADGNPVNCSIQIECVDMFDYLNGFGLTPGLAGVVPPAGAEDGVYYAATSGTGKVHDRIVEILTDAHVDFSRYLVSSGNTQVIAVKYDPGESALTALRDAADAEFPFISNIYVDRFGAFAFRGRYSRFNPDDVAAEPGSDWDFARWAVGDEKAILADPGRAQMRVLEFARDRGSIINVAGCWTQNLPAADMPDQFFADTSSITAYGQHAAPPMSDLLTGDYAGPGTLTPGNGKQQCFLFAKLLVKNQAFPREAVTALQVKAIHPGDYRAAETWAFITESDISHIVNVRVGYPGGTGFTGTSPKDDYYIEGRSLVVRPLNPAHDYVEYNVEVSPAIWSQDTHSVFPAFAPPS